MELNEPLQTRALTGLTFRLKELPRTGLLASWAELRPVLLRRHRQSLLSGIQALAPVIAALGGEDAIEETICAIQDVGRWWP